MNQRQHLLSIIAHAATALGWIVSVPDEDGEVRGLIVGRADYLEDIGVKDVDQDGEVKLEWE